MKKYLILLMSIFFVLAGCDTASAPNITPAPVIEATAEPTQPPANPTPKSDVPEKLLTLAKEDLAERLGVATSEISLLSAKSVEWSDASLGCPEPDMMYAQVITPGYRLMLTVDERPYAYHTDDDSHVVFCPREGTFPVNPDEIQDGEPWVPVD